ncbi:MAG: TetR/AcrR family transcriptional regulator [Proteobacteria bacterium]|nr:TetR/AcrR family transcriptional regulator [Pseudomonadota bacterium]
MDLQPTAPVISPRRRGRPPKSANGFSETREALLRAGVEVLTEKGFSATGIDQILSRVGVPKGSFYHFFPSKEAFGSALIERYAGYFARKLDRFLLDESQPPLQRLHNFVADAADGMARFEFRRGCLVGNLGQETASLPDALRLQLSAVFADWETRVATCLEAARANSAISADADCQRLANCFWIGWEGAVLRAKLEASSRPLEVFADFFFAGLPR